jgi:hypothetical protein
MEVLHTERVAANGYYADITVTLAKLPRTVAQNGTVRGQRWSLLRTVTGAFPAGYVSATRKDAMAQWGVWQSEMVATRAKVIDELNSPICTIGAEQ